MFLSTLKALDRKSGKPVTLIEVVSTGPGATEVGKVSAAYQKIIGSGSEGVAMRAKYSSVLFMVDNQVRNLHHFPDIVAQQAKAQDSAALSAAREQLAATVSRLRELNGARETLLNEHEVARRAIVAAGGSASDTPAAIRPDVELKTAQDELAQMKTELEASQSELAKIKANQEAAEKAVQEKNKQENAELAKANTGNPAAAS